MHNHLDWIAQTTFSTQVVEHWLERKITQWVHYEGLTHCTMNGQNSTYHHLCYTSRGALAGMRSIHNEWIILPWPSSKQEMISSTLCRQPKWTGLRVGGLFAQKSRHSSGSRRLLQQPMWFRESDMTEHKTVKSVVTYKLKGINKAKKKFVFLR